MDKKGATELEVLRFYIFLCFFRYLGASGTDLGASGTDFPQSWMDFGGQVDNFGLILGTKLTIWDPVKN